MINEPSGQDQVIQSSAKKSKHKVAIAGLACALLGWFSMPTLSQWAGGVPSFEEKSMMSSKVFKGTLVRDIAVSGKLVAANAPTLYSTESGQVTLTAKPGDKVAKNDVVATLASPELKATIAQEQSKLARLKIEASRGELIDSEAQLDLERSLDTAQVRLNASTRELERAQVSFEKQVISQLDYVTTKDAKLEAELFYQHAKKRVELAKKRLSFENQTRQFSVKSQQLVVNELERRKSELAIRAPVAGIVGNWLVQQKERVAVSQAIMTIVDLSQYEAELNVPEFYADDLGLGLQVSLKIAGNTLTGQVSSISPEVKGSQVMVRVRVDANNDIKLRQNQRLNARIEFEKKDNVLMVKRGDFLKSTAGKAAFVISSNTATMQPISIGSQSVEFVEITSGLSAGDDIIISDYTDFEANQQIRITQ